jgi:hypothetical protein
MTEQPPQENRSGDSGDSRSSEKEEIALAINALKREYESAQTQREEHDRQSLKWTRRTAKAAVAYTVLTALLLSAGIYSGIQAMLAIGVANRQAAISEDAAKRQLRAYVFVDQIWITGVDSITGTETFVRIKNSGLTPAYGLIHANTYFIGEFPLKKPLRPVTIMAYGADDYSFSELGPGGIHDKPKRHNPVTPLQVAGLRAGTFAIYFYGGVAFTDAFGCHRWMRYRSVLGGPLANRGLNLAFANNGNDTSDETAQDCLFKAPQ